MSDNIVEITQTSDYTISIDTSLVQNDNNVTIELSSPNTIDIINNNTTILLGDLPEGYPIAWTSGDLPISRVSGLIGESGIYYNNGTIGISGIPYDLIPVHNILNGSGISVTNTSGIFTIAVTGNFGLTSEEVDDRVNSLLIPGNYITLNYNDNANTLTISTSGLQPSGNYSTVGHTHISSNITDFNSAVSGLIPPSSFTSLTGLSGIVVTNSGTNYFVALNDPTIQLIDITDLSADARTFLLTPSSNNLQNLITNETGSGVVVFNNSPEFSGIPTVPTAPSGTNSNQIANTAFVRTEISNLVDSAPGTLDTLNELAAALGDDANFATTVTNSLANKANLSGAIFTGPVTIPSGTGNFNSLSVNGIVVSISGHQHQSSDITNFNSSVSGLLPVTNITAGSGIGVSSLSGNYTISVTGTFGLTSEEVDDRVNGLLVASSGITLNYDDNANSLTIGTSGLAFVSGASFNNLFVTGVPVSVSGHKHNYTDIINFASGVEESISTILVAGSFINLFYDALTDSLTISATGLQPSGSYANSTHTHGNISNSGTIGSTSGLLVVTGNSGILTTSSGISSNYITNFNSSVSGLLPVKDILAGSGIGISSLSGNYTVSVTGTFGLTSEEVDDRVSNLLVAGSGISLNYNDNANTLTITSLQNYEEILEYDLPSSFPAVGNIQILYIATDISRLYKWTGYEYVEIGPSSAYVENHTHISSNITDFSSSVSGLLPVKNITAGSGIGVSSVSGDYTISVTGSFGLTSEEVDDRVSNLLVAGNYINIDYNDNSDTLTISASGLQPSGSYASGIHYHISSDITDFNTGVSGLLPSVTGSGYVSSSFSNNIYTISVSGLQPSGNYSLVGHTHSSSDITDFNSAVSGLIPVKNILGGTGISVSSLSGVYTIDSTGSGVLSDQAKSLVTTVFNKTGSPIPKMTAVYINGGQGDLPTVSLAIATSDMTSAGTYGLTYEAISNMQSGKVIVFGALTGLNTDQFNPTAPTGNVNGSVIYLSPTTSGALTLTKPSAPNHIVAIGTIVRTHQNEGVIEVRVQNGFELDELHNVAISGVSNGQFLQYNSPSGLWVPSSSGNFSSLSVNGTGVSVNGHTHTSSQITDFNSSVSGLLPTIANSGDNRILTSTGSAVGINAENNLTFDGSVLNIDGNLVFDSFTESLTNNGSSGSGVILSLSSGTVHTCTLTNNCTFTMPSSTAGKSFTLFLNTGSGNYTASFSGVLWSDNAPPTITSLSNKIDILSFISDGTYWYGSYSQNYG